MSLPEQVIYRRAVEKWGTNSQIYMAIQEMSELTKELTNHLLGRWEKYEDMPAEIADVEIMIEQIKVIFGLHGAVKIRKEEKLKRLLKLLEHAEAK